MTKTVEQMVEEMKAKYPLREYDYQTNTSGCKGIIEVVPSGKGTAIVFKHYSLSHWNMSLQHNLWIRVYNGKEDIRVEGCHGGLSPSYSPKVLSFEERDNGKYALKLEDWRRNPLVVNIDMNLGIARCENDGKMNPCGSPCKEPIPCEDCHQGRKGCCCSH
jgi:hypothetical protein